MTRVSLHSWQRRGVTLIEAVAVVLVLAISIPPTISWMSETSARQADAINLTRATTLASTVLEQVLADGRSSAAGLGFSAFNDTSAYLDAPTVGLRARLSSTTSLYTSMGFTYEVGFTGLISPSGVASADTAKNVCRRVDVGVKFPSASGPERTVSISALLTSP